MELLQIVSYALISTLFVLIYRYEYKRYKSYFTPSIILIVPFYIVLTLALTVGPLLGFYQVDYRVMLIWFVGVSLFWLTGYFVMKTPKPRFKTLIKTTQSNEKKHVMIGDLLRQRKIITILSYSILGVSFVYLFISLSRFTGEGDFNEFFDGGIFAHLRILICLAIIVHFGLFSKKRLRYGVFILLALVFLLLTSVPKMDLVLTLCASVIFKMYVYNIKVSKVKLLLFGIFMYIMAMMTYIIEFTVIRGEQFSFDMILFTLKHVMIYFMGGVISGGGYLDLNLPTIGFRRLLQPVLTILNFVTFNVFSDFLMGDLQSGSFSDIMMPIGEGVSTNVSTLFVEVYLVVGPVGLILICILLSLVVHKLFTYFISNKSVWLTIAYSYVVIGLAIGWFSWSYALLRYWEIAFFCIVFHFIYKYYKNKKRQRLLKDLP